MHIIELNGEKFQLKFGYGAFRILASAWDCKGIQSVAAKFQEIFPAEATEDAEISFEQADQIGDLVLAGIQNANPGAEQDLDRDEVVGLMMFDPTKLQLVITAFMESFPQAGKAQPQPKQGKKKGKK